MSKDFAAEAGHWYSADGSPQYTTIGKNGASRNTTLRDARALNLFPSVTTIIKAAAAPGLEVWKIDQAIMAALTLPRNDGELEADWIKRVKQDAKETARKAAERGTQIHAAIEGHYQGKVPDGEMWPFVKGAVSALNDHFGHGISWGCEKSFSHPLGFGGKVDLHAKQERIVVDFKGKDFGPDDDVKMWDEQVMQGAAYLHGFDLMPGRFANVFVSRNNPGLVRVVEANPEDIQRGWRMFRNLLGYWQEANKYAPITKDAA